MANVIELKLEVDDRGSVKIQKFASDAKAALTGVEEHSKKAGGGIDSLKNSWALMSAGIASSIYIFNQAHDKLKQIVALGEEGAKIQRMETSFKAVATAAGLHADSVVKALRTAAQGMMDESDIMARASRLIQENIPVKTLEDLMKALAKQAPIVGDTLPDAWDKFSQALITGNLRMIKLYTGTLDLEKVYEDFARSVGRTKDELTEETKLKIRSEEITKILSDKVKDLGNQEETASEKIIKAKVQLQEAHEKMQKAWIPIATSYYQILAKIAETWNQWGQAAPEDKGPLPPGIPRLEGFNFPEAPSFLPVSERGASGSWGASIDKFTIDNALANMLPTEYTFQKDNAAIKKALDERERIIRDFNALQNQQYYDAEQKIAEVTAKFFEDKRKEEEKAFEDSKKLTKEIYDDQTKALYEAEKQIAETYIKFEEDKRKEVIKTAEDEKKAAQKRWELEKSMSDEIAKMDKNNFNLIISNLEKEYQTRKKVVGDSEQLEEWYRLKRREIYEEMTLRSDDFWAGVSVQIDRNLRDQYTWAEQGAKIWNSMFGKAGVLEDNLNGFFNDFFRGELKTAKDYFEAFKEEILSIFARMIAQMVAQWAASGIASFFGLGSGGGGGVSLFGGGGGGGGSLGGGLGNSLLNTGLNAGLSYAGGQLGISSLSGAATQLGSLYSTGALVNLGGDVTAAGAGGAAGSSGAASGMGGLGALGPAAAIYAGVAAYGMYGAKNFGGTGRAINPFYNYPEGPGFAAYINPWGEDATGYDWGKYPGVEYYREKFQRETGFAAPTAAWIDANNEPYELYKNWMTSQPEIYNGSGDFLNWLNSKNRGSINLSNLTGMAEAGIMKEALPSPAGANGLIAMARGGVIDEPMVAFGKSGKRVLMGERGREYVVPEGSGGGITIIIEGNLIGTEDSINKLVSEIDYRIQKLNRWQSA